MANTALARFTAGVTFIAGQLATFTDFRRFQNAIRQNTMEALFGRLFLNGTTLRNGFFGDDCLVTSSGGLNYSVAPGMGFFFDSAVTDEFTAQYRPIVVPSAITGTLDAHDATNPRIDIICLAPAYDSDVSESITVRAADGSLTTPTADRRSLYYRAIQVVAGTPSGTPSAPATPTGYLRLCQAAVPAVSGDIVITDARALMVMSPGALGNSSVDTDQLANGAVETAKIAAANVTAIKCSFRPVTPGMTAGAEGVVGANIVRVDFQVTDMDGVPVVGTYVLQVELKDGTGEWLGTGAGYTFTINTGSHKTYTHDPAVAVTAPYRLIETNGTGAAQIDVEDVTTGTNRGVHMFATVLNEISALEICPLDFN